MKETVKEPIIPERKFPFTKGRIDTLVKVHKAGLLDRKVYWDTKRPGFCILVGSTSMSYKVQRHVRGIKGAAGEFHEVVGRVGEIDLETADKRAKALIDQCNDRIDPRDEKRKAKAAEAERLATEARKSSYTLASLCTAYTDYLENQGKHASAGNVRSTFNCWVLDKEKAGENIATIAVKPARDVTSLEVALIVRTAEEAGRRRTAAMLRTSLHAAYECARKAPLSPRLPTAFIPYDIMQNPVTAVSTIPSVARNRTLSAEELRDYLRQLHDPYRVDDIENKALLVALLAGGQRMEQVLRATVDDWSPDTQQLRLFDPKGRRRQPREHILPLAPQAAAIVDALAKRAQTLKRPWLFTADRKYDNASLASSTVGGRLFELRKKIDCAQFDLRDIRRTCETMLAGLGISRDVRAQLLSHGISGVQAVHYDRHDYINEKAAALIAWENRLDDILAARSSTNMVELRPRVAA